MCSRMCISNNEPCLSHLRCVVAMQLSTRPTQPRPGKKAFQDCRQVRCNRVCRHATSVTDQDLQYAWHEPDAFSALDDRKDLPPLPLPNVDFRRRIVLVRHGQSTWNAEGRIQGSSDFSELTAKGIAQAETTRDMLRDESFDALFVSPLRRARQTADIITGVNSSSSTSSCADLDPQVLPSLREVDLYSFQGLLKAQGKERYGPQYTSWQRAAADFTLDGHPPVRELWHRASLAWQQLLDPTTGVDGAGALCSLVVAHNAVNQALIATALGLPPVYFRRLLQSNAATTVLDIQPPQPAAAAAASAASASGNGAGSISSSRPRVTLDRLNQSPGRPYQPDGPGRPAMGRLVLVRHATTPGSAEGVLLGGLDEGLSSLGLVQAGKTAEFLLDMKVSAVVTSPAQRCAATAKLVADLQEESPWAGLTAAEGGPRGRPQVLMMGELTNLDVGGWQGQPTRLVQGQPFPDDAEQLSHFWERTTHAWDKLRDMAAEGGGANVVVVGHAAVHAALVCHCLGLGPDALSLFRFDTAGVSIIDFPDGPFSHAPGGGAGVLRCLNYTAHLGRWAVPISRDDLDGVCGIDGCF